ncbi:hypothetical protein Droror1_Dr00019888 [Drosera rotundifolia]
MRIDCRIFRMVVCDGEKVEDSAGWTDEDDELISRVVEESTRKGEVLLHKSCPPSPSSLSAASSSILILILRPRLFHPRLPHSPLPSLPPTLTINVACCLDFSPRVKTPFWILRRLLQLDGMEIEFDGTNHLILKEDDIVAILEIDDVKDLKPLNDRVLVKVQPSSSFLISVCNFDE